MAEAAVDNLLRISKRVNFPYPAVHLNNIPHGDLSKQITKVIDEFKPDTVFTHHADLNIDHVFAMYATMVACRPPKKIKLLTYEVPSSTEISPTPFMPNTYVVLSRFHVAKKLNAYSLYDYEIKNTRSRHKVKSLMTHRGNDILVNHAEAFHLIREVIE